jgi:hypothetical protein
MSFNDENTLQRSWIGAGLHRHGRKVKSIYGGDILRRRYMESYEHMSQSGDSRRSYRSEDQFTKSVEEYTAAIPSSAHLGVAIGAMALSLFCQAAGGENGEISSRSGFRHG